MSADTGTSDHGILPIQRLKAGIRDGWISADPGILDEQLQPASLDLRLGPRAFRVVSSFLPGPERTVEQKLDDLQRSQEMYELDLSKPTVLERGCVYIVPLLERLDLPPAISGTASPKSSTGRLDVFTRLIVDRASGFERVPAGYAGPMYLEIAPRTFSIVVRAGIRLNQIRFRVGTPGTSDRQLQAAHDLDPMIFAGGASAEAVIADGLWVAVDLVDRGDDPVAYRARRHAPLLDLSKIAHYDPLDFWEPILGNPAGRLILNPDDFYLLASREGVRVPPGYSAEMVPYDTAAGEFRVHYAGFFDPGFGHRAVGLGGTPAVLEVRSHEVPFALEHGQRVARLKYERLTAVPDVLYGQDLGSNYADQRLNLAKFFRPFSRRGVS
jgi:dCTP deaminase